MFKKLFFFIIFPIFLNASIQINLKFSPSDLEFYKIVDPLDINELEYDKVSLCVRSAVVAGMTPPGTPSIGGVGRSVLIPPNATITDIKVVSSDSVQIPGEYKIYPVQKDVAFSYPDPKFTEPDEEVYNSKELFPGRLVRLNGTSSLSGYRVGGFMVYPLQYIPSKGTLFLYTDIVLEIDYEIEKITIQKMTEEQIRIYSRSILNMVINPEDISKFTPPKKSTFSNSRLLPSDEVEYVIVAPASDTAEYDDLLYWKKKKGIKNPKTIALEWIYSEYSVSGDTNKIAHFVADAETTWGTMYFLMAGDPYDPSFGEIVPMAHMRADAYPESPLSDRYYAETDLYLDGSEPGNAGAAELEDVMVSRIPIDDASDVQTFVMKTLRHEKNPVFEDMNPSYNNPVIYVPVYELWDDWTGDIPADTIAAQTPDPWLDSIRYSTNSPTTAELNAACQSGLRYTHYIGHGSETYWGEYGNYQYKSDVESFTNFPNTPILSQICCHTNAMGYSSEDCFSEGYINNPNGGVVALEGNTHYGLGSRSGVWDDENESRSSGLCTDFYRYQWVWGNDRHFQEAWLHAKNYVTSSYISGHSDIYSVWSRQVINMLGDPELPLYTTPYDIGELSVFHPPAKSVGTGVFTVTVTDSATGAPIDSAKVCLWCKNESSMWMRGWTNASGMVTLMPDPGIVGDTMWVTATKANYKPIESFARVVAGMQFIVIPDTIYVNIPTDIEVTVMDSTGTNPLDSIEIHIYKYGVSEFDTTNVMGVCSLNVNSAYGQMLMVDGRKIDETWNSFTDTIWVIGASDFTEVNIGAFSDTIGVVGGLMPEIPGTAWGYTLESEFTFYLEGCGIDTSTSTVGDSVYIDVVPAKLGNILGTIGKSGYNLYQDNIPVKIYKGYLSGYVIDIITSDSIENARVLGYRAGVDTSSNDPVFDVSSDENGFYESGDSIPCGYYDIYTSCFGYEPDYAVLTLVLGNNYKNTFLNPASSCIVYGTVTETGTGNPLISEVRVYRSDDDSLYQTAYTDTAAGGFYEVELPQFKYRFLVRSYMHTPVDSLVNLNTDSLELNFVMDSTSGMILVIDDDYAKGSRKISQEDLKRGEKKDIVSASKIGVSSEKFYRWLSDLGYYVDTATVVSTDTAEWSNYDFLVVSCGANEGTLDTNQITLKLMDWVDKGGKLLIEGGELGYDWDGTQFGYKVLHITDWDTDYAGNLILQNDTHPLATIPNILPDSMSISYTGYGDEDACAIDSDAELIYGTNIYPQDAGLLLFDPTPPIESGQIVYYAFNLDALVDTLIAKELVENSAYYLLCKEPVGSDTLYGYVDLFDMADDSGAEVTVRIGLSVVGSDLTDEYGYYEITGLYDGVYDIIASKEGFLDSVVTGVNITGNLQMDFTLYPVIILYEEDFEDSDGEYSSTGDWQWGIPTYGPSQAHSGVNLWGTNLSGEYSSYSNSRLTTVNIDLSGVSKPLLSFYQWYNTESYYDGGNVKISVNGGSWKILDGLNPPYNDTASIGNSGIPGEPCYSGNGQGYWEEVKRDLSDYVDSTVTLRFHFGSDVYVEYPGWYIDDVVVYYISWGGVEDSDELPTIYGMAINGLSVWNEFSLKYSLPERSEVNFKVYDISGREIKSLRIEKDAGYHEMEIDMLDYPAGVYFIHMDANGNKFTSKAVLLR
jgi:hypothetical protein